MKKQFYVLISVCIFWYASHSQTIHGRMVELVKNDVIKIPLFSKAKLLVETESEKIEIHEDGIVAPYQVQIDEWGQFTLDMKKIQGDFVSLYLESENYAPSVLRKIPKEKLPDFIQIIPVTRTIKKVTGSFESFSTQIDLKKTFKRKEFMLLDAAGKRKIIFKKTENPFTLPKLKRKENLFDSEYFYEFIYGLKK